MKNLIVFNHPKANVHKLDRVSNLNGEFTFITIIKGT
jgi:hypothetical protein